MASFIVLKKLGIEIALRPPVMHASQRHKRTPDYGRIEVLREPLKISGVDVLQRKRHQFRIDC